MGAGKCYDPSTHVCFGGNYGYQIKYGICKIGMNKCLGECYDGPDELCCTGGYMFQDSFPLSSPNMTCCNNLQGHYECPAGQRCIKESYKAWCEGSRPSWTCHPPKTHDSSFRALLDDVFCLTPACVGTS